VADLLQALVDGLADGSVYGALGLALALVYRSTGIVNFAQGELAMVSTFGAWSLARAGVDLPVAALLSAGASFVAGAVLERVAIRPVEGRDTLSVVIVTLGLSILLNSAAGVVWGLETRAFPGLFGDGALEAAGARLSLDALGTAGVLLTVVGALWILSGRTSLGLAMRASAADPTTSRLLGMRVGRTLMFGWGLAAGIGAIAGVLVAHRLFLDVNLMAGVIIYALAAVCLGGFDSPFGAVVGGWIVGVCQSLAASYVGFVGADLQILVPFAVIVLVLLLRPHGLFGSTDVARA